MHTKKPPNGRLLYGKKFAARSRSNIRFRIPDFLSFSLYEPVAGLPLPRGDSSRYPASGEGQTAKQGSWDDGAEARQILRDSISRYEATTDKPKF